MGRPRYESLGVYLPERIVSSTEIMERTVFPNTSILAGITGIKERRFRADNEDTLTLGAAAARACLEHSQYQPCDLDVVISASITQFHTPTETHIEPSTSFQLKQILEAPQALNFDVSNACAGMATGAYVLDGMIRSGMVRNGMIVSGECISPIAESAVKEIESIDDPQFASLTIGDAGAAFILDDKGTEDEGIDFIEMVSLAEFCHLCVGQLNERIGGVSMYSQIIGLFRAGAGELFSRCILDAVSKNGRTLNREDYDHVIFHQVSVQNIEKNVEYLKREFKLDVPRAFICADTVGNTASTSHTVALHQALKKGEVKPFDRILWVVQASGINLGVLSMSVGDLEVSSQ